MQHSGNSYGDTNKPARLFVYKIPATIISAGTAVASIDIAKP